MMALGGFISLSDRRLRVGVAQKAKPASLPRGTVAGVV